ncbi:MAG: hypothetical protein MSIBF_00380 [Candidatus Altiarchaeales archaeon IMC4]|nr:MAG: hypothetical protein MSIBF_00380 [Candidatus Altiarchaeales archaeon IMC4]
MKTTKRKIFSAIVISMLIMEAMTAVSGDWQTECIKGFVGGIGAAVAEMYLARHVLVDKITGVTDEVMEPFYLDFRNMILKPPVMSGGTRNLMLFFIHVLEPVFVAAIMLLGAYIIFASGSIKMRAKAKAILPNLILGMVLITLSGYILDAMVSVSYNLTSLVINLNSDDLKQVYDTTLNGWLVQQKYGGNKDINVEWAMPYAGLAIMLTGGPMLVMAVRYLVVIFFSVMFPLTLFLYFFRPTRGIGRTMLEQTLLWNFVSVVEALALFIALYGMKFINTQSGELQHLMAMTTLVMLIVVPFMFISSFKHFLP